MPTFEERVRQINYSGPIRALMIQVSGGGTNMLVLLYEAEIRTEITRCENVAEQLEAAKSDTNAPSPSTN